MPEWWESAPLANQPKAPVRPQGGRDDWWKAAPLADAYERPIPPGAGPRDLDLEFSQEEADTAGRTGAVALGMMGGAAIPGVGSAVMGAARLATNPYAGAALYGGQRLIETGDPGQAAAAAATGFYTQKLGGKVLGKVAEKVGGWMSKALSARLTHQVARAAKTIEPAAAEVAEQAAPAAAKAVDMDALLIRATDATAPPQVRHAARVALQKAGWTPDRGMVAAPIEEAVAPAVRKLAPIPERGNVKMATVYSRPAGAPPTKSKAVSVLGESGRRNLKEEQLAAAKAAGVDVGEAFGTAPVAARAEQAAESALETRLRASVLMKKDPAALANEIADHVVGLGKVKPERAADVVQELYGIPAANAKQMVEMVFQAQGWK